MYTKLTAKAYLPRTEKNQETIELIESGILKEVSVGCSMKRSVCSICGKEHCNHVKGRTYEGQMCHRVLCDPADASNNMKERCPWILKKVWRLLATRGCG